MFLGVVFVVVALVGVVIRFNHQQYLGLHEFKGVHLT